MDGLRVEQINDDNRTYSIIRMRCVVNEFLASEEKARELSAREFEIVLAGLNEVNHV